MPTIDEHSLIDEAGNRYAESCRDDFDAAVSRMSDRCESPIERVLVAALIAELSPNNFSTLDVYGPNPLLAKSLRKDGSAIELSGLMLGGDPTIFYSQSTLTVFSQAVLGDYRVDFLIVMPRLGAAPHLVVIECDGHDFHEKTKEQARRDKRRDRWLLKNRIFCLRFTGSEIWNDGERCASEIADFCFKLP